MLVSERFRLAMAFLNLGEEKDRAVTILRWILYALRPLQAEVNVKTTDGWTPLYGAAVNGHVDVVKFLIEQQAELNMKTSEGWTPIHGAARKGHLDVVEFLVEQQGF